MYWKHKAFLQNVVASLPMGLSDFVYHLVMKYGGGYVPYMNPVTDYQRSLQFVEYIEKYHPDFSGKTFFELGTGRSISMPIGIWLLGANKIITSDLNRFLREEVALAAIDRLKNEEFVQKAFGARASDLDLKKRIVSITECERSLSEIFRITGIQYIAPCDATQLAMEDDSIDIHYSTSVLEHVPEDVIASMCLEARRVLTKDGIFIHYVNVSDHYTNHPSEPCGDSSISTINFLQFCELEWLRISGNKFNFHNRLRTIEYKRLFESKGLKTLAFNETFDERAMDLIKNKKIHIDRQFQNFSTEELSAFDLWYIGKFGS
ncbi:MAG: methyltransferase family protein [Magnetococcales bacterium]|nr:methyltransferase family protein [Magnetococcales bacterium]